MKSLKSLAKPVVYGALDLWTGGRGVKRYIGGEAIRFPARWCRYYPTDYEPATFAFLRAHCRPGNTVMDIGAHIGLFSVLMARLVAPTGRVFSFEPTPHTRQVLQETIQINECTIIVEVRTEAVAASSGTTTFYDTGTVLSNANSLVRTERSQHGFSVATVSIDDFVSQHARPVQCIKIDVEGAEKDVLLGASHTFLTHRPVALLALHPSALQQSGKTLAGIWDLLQQYRMSVLHLGQAVDEGWFCRQEDLFDVELLPQS